MTQTDPLNDKSYMFEKVWGMLARTHFSVIPHPTPEYPFAKAWKRKFRFDWCFTDAKVAVEVDGGTFAYGGGRHAKDSDREKTNIAAAMGYRVFRFSPAMLNKNPVGCVELVVMALKGDKVTQ
jgi:hypothetical protein